MAIEKGHDFEAQAVDRKLRRVGPEQLAGGFSQEMCPALRFNTFTDVVDRAGETGASGREGIDMEIAARGLGVRLEFGRPLRRDHLREARQILRYMFRVNLAHAPSHDLFAGYASVMGVGVICFQDAPIDRLPRFIVEQLVQGKAFGHVLEEQTVLLFALPHCLPTHDRLNPTSQMAVDPPLERHCAHRTAPRALSTLFVSDRSPMIRMAGPGDTLSSIGIAMTLSVLACSGCSSRSTISIA